ncbi:MAG: hypothetical protein IT270_09075 [Saprospiraceae bacterium]|nr:hypothetical protein [Saprospiraceae bacterium]
MNLKQQIEHLASDQEGPCVTITLNTHRTHPDNVKDGTVLKNLCHEAEKTVLETHTKRDVTNLLTALQNLPGEVDVNQNLDSLCIFVSNNTHEVVRSMWPVAADAVSVSNQFALRHLILELNRTQNYLILLLSRSGVHLYQAENDAITGEVNNDDFPFKESQHIITDKYKISDAKQGDNMVREYFNKVDKAVQRAAKEQGLKVVVVATDENFQMLGEVTDNASTYLGSSAVNYNDTAPHTLARQGWELVKEGQVQHRTDAIAELQQAVSDGLVLTDPTEIYKAALEGRGDLLITREGFQNRAVFNEDSLDLFDADAEDVPGDAFDFTSAAAWEVISKGGRALFTDNDDLLEFGDMALKVRYI